MANKYIKAGRTPAFFLTIMMAMVALSRYLSRAGWLLMLLLALGVYGFFYLTLAGENRVLAALWNLSHIAYFFLLCILALRLLLGIQRLSFWPLLLWVCGAAIVLGLVIELLQSLVSRSMSLNDILFDMLGAALAVCCFAPQRWQLSAGIGRLLRAVMLLLLLAALWPAYRIGMDEYYMQRQFPVLGDFSTPYELTRWHAAQASVTRVVSGEAHRLRARFLPARYPTILFEHFPPDWRGYKRLVIDLENPAQHAIRVTLRIHDAEHDLHDNVHSDRFNRSYELAPGMQQISIDLAELAAAPATRTMDMAKIQNISLFIFETTTEHTLDILRLYLE